MRDDREWLLNMLKAIDRILARTTYGRAAFDRDEMLQVWVLHHLQIVGEAARSLSGEFRARHSGNIWSKAVGMRNILVHHSAIAGESHRSPTDAARPAIEYRPTESIH